MTFKLEDMPEVNRTNVTAAKPLPIRMYESKGKGSIAEMAEYSCDAGCKCCHCAGYAHEQ